MVNGGYEEELVVENNPQYEDTLEVAKKAGLTGTGRRKKENVVYEETFFNRKRKHTPPPTLRASNLQPRPTEEWSGIQKSRNDQWKMPFVIHCVLILLCLVGSALGVFAYLDDKECSCEKTNVQGVNTDPAKLTDDIKENFTKTINLLEQKLNILQAKLNSIETEQKTQLATIPGPRGYNGTQGNTGPQGPPGIQGLQGPRGLTIDGCWYKSFSKNGTSSEHKVALFRTNSTTQLYYGMTCKTSLADQKLAVGSADSNGYICTCQNTVPRTSITCTIDCIYCTFLSTTV